ncbi:MAG TPA: hypothetical protein VNN10_12650 [Dehalococcoidia bacterium]|nr:hypothetical protein [Dehalococcoidia bacterium]
MTGCMLTDVAATLHGDRRNGGRADKAALLAPSDAFAGVRQPLPGEVARGDGDGR